MILTVSAKDCDKAIATLKSAGYSLQQIARAAEDARLASISLAAALRTVPGP